MEAKLISLDDYVRTGEGANGASYNHKSDPNIMMKMYFRNFEAAALELEVAKKVYEMGIPTPEPGDLVTDGKQMGIRFRRIEGKKSYSRACGDHPERAEEYGKEFAKMCKKLHSVHVDTTRFENVKDRLYKMLDANPDFTPEQKQKIRAFIQAAAICSSATVFLPKMPTANVRLISSTLAISVTAIRCLTLAWFISAAVSTTRVGRRRSIICPTLRRHVSGTASLPSTSDRTPTWKR